MKTPLEKWPKFDPRLNTVLCRECWNCNHKFCEGNCGCYCKELKKEKHERRKPKNSERRAPAQPINQKSAVPYPLYEADDSYRCCDDANASCNESH